VFLLVFFLDFALRVIWRWDDDPNVLNAVVFASFPDERPWTNRESSFMICSKMTARPTSQTRASRTAAPAEGGGDWARAMLERDLEILGELAEDGLAWSKAIQRQGIRQAEAAGPDEAEAPAPRAELSRSYAQVTRAVRLAVMLRAKLIHELRELDAAPPMHANRKLGVLRVVKRAAQAEFEDDDRVERLVREAAERLDREDICADLMSKPTSEIIAFICKDLGLEPDWPELAQEAWEEAKRNADPAKKMAPEPVKYTVSWLDPQPAPPKPQSASP
jgi:hypothetical protein